MKSITGWVKQPKAAGGLDHLGSQAPCINLYGRLLPGITNVTDRARYYSFYPWFFWAYEKYYQTLKWEEVVARYRKADCLFTLIAARHANQTDKNDDNHGIAMIGRNTLVNALKELETNGKPLLLSTYATRELNTQSRYFKNKLGGLGQYYIGTFKELGLLDGNSRTGVQYTVPRANEIAEAIDAGVERKLFFNSIDNDEITLTVLDALVSFCPCQLPQNSNEKSVLIDLFFDRKNIYGDDGIRRRLTLCMLLSLIDQLEKIAPNDNVVLDHFVFRGSVYSGYLKSEVKWQLSEALEKTRKEWAIYQTNELLSIALQSIFWTVLTVLSESDRPYYSSELFFKDFARSEIVENALGDQKDFSVLNAVVDVKNQLPALSDWENDDHECYKGRNLYNECSNRKNDPPLSNILQQALNIILTLAARIDPDSKPYGPFEFPDNYFSYYPINLHTFQFNLASTWENLSLRELFEWLAHKWGIETHLRVALRKLRRDKLDTFRVRPTDEGLKVVEIPEPVFTSPRFKQGLRMLRDLGAIDGGTIKGSYKITELGRELLETTFGN